MWNNSVVSITGQTWKLVVGSVALVVGSVAPLFAATGMSWTGGTILATVGYVYSLVAIRCPGCGRRWFWEACLDAGLYRPLFTKPACPHCQHEFQR
jgi:hypothetical protein